MNTLTEKLNTKLKEWQPDTAEEVQQLIIEIIELADQDALNILRSRICRARSIGFYSMNPKPGEVWLADLGLIFL